MTNLLKELEIYGADIKGIMERFIGDEELYCTCFNTFLNDLSFQGIGESLNAKNYEQAFEYAHALKGVSGNLGLTPLYNNVSELVEKLRAKDYTNLEPYYDAIMKEFDKLKTYRV